MHLSQFDEIARLQCGLVTREQALQVVTPQQLRYLIRAHYLLIVQKNVYRLPGTPQTWKQRILALSLSFDGKAAISHRSAAQIYNLPGYGDSVLEITVELPNRRSPAGVQVHYVRQKDFNHHELGPLVVTPIARTLIDLAAVSTQGRVAAAVDSALNRRLLTTGELRTEFEERCARGRTGIAKFRRIFTSAVEECSRSELERRARRWISDFGLPAPVGQHLVWHQGVPYRLDLAWPDIRVAVEPAGFTYHRGRQAFDDDASKVAALMAEQWRIVPMTSRTDRSIFLNNLRAVLRSAA